MFEVESGRTSHLHSLCKMLQPEQWRFLLWLLLEFWSCPWSSCCSLLQQGSTNKKKQESSSNKQKSWRARSKESKEAERQWGKAGKSAKLAKLGFKNTQGRIIRVLYSIYSRTGFSLVQLVPLVVFPVMTGLAFGWRIMGLVNHTNLTQMDETCWNRQPVSCPWSTEGFAQKRTQNLGTPQDLHVTHTHTDTQKKKCTIDNS